MGLENGGYPGSDNTHVQFTLSMFDIDAVLLLNFSMPQLAEKG